MIRAHMIRQLDGEAMDLLPAEALELPEPLRKTLPLYGHENQKTTP